MKMFGRQPSTYYMLNKNHILVPLVFVRHPGRKRAKKIRANKSIILATLM
jgi:hypothetical protein